MVEWHILTGQYPPQPGGVGDHSRLIAHGLARDGEVVHVWAPEPARAGPDEAGVQVHRLPGIFGRRALARFETALRRRSSPRRLLVQYVPHAFGWKAMNVPFCLWLYRQRRRERIWVMFHEVAFPLRRGQPLRHNLLGWVNRGMAALLARAAEQCFVATPAWIPLLRRLHDRDRPITWLPVPSNLPTEVDPAAVAAVRGRYAPDQGQQVVGHFGFDGGVTPLVEQVLPAVLAGGGRRVGLLLGRGGERLVPPLLRRHPALAGRVFATGELAPAALALGLAACDLLVQPYPDGVSCRRTSLLAGLALGVPVATTEGHLTEPLWQEQGLAALAPVGEPAALAAAADRLLGDPPAARRLGERGRAGYRTLFSLRHCLSQLRCEPPTGR